MVYGLNLKTVGGIIILVGMIAGLIFGMYEVPDEYGDYELQINWYIAFLYWISGLLTGLFFGWLGEIATTIEKIHQELVTSRNTTQDKNPLITSDNNVQSNN